MVFDYCRIESYAFSCRKCGDRVCICESKGMWAAHCMTCDNSIGHKGYYDPCATSKWEACRQWNKRNKGCYDPCPDCGRNLICGDHWSGVKCPDPKCGYWFCY